MILHAYFWIFSSIGTCITWWFLTDICKRQDICIMQCLWFILLFSDDLSFGKIASQSHSYWGSSYYANDAIDRKTTTCSRTQDIGYASMFKTVWWKVDLGRVHNLYNMGILFESYDGYGMYTYNPNNRKHYRFFYVINFDMR